VPIAFTFVVLFHKFTVVITNERNKMFSLDYTATDVMSLTP